MEGTKEPESSGVLPALKNQKNGGSELVLWETLGNYFFWICIPWCNQPSAGHVRSSLWPYGGTTGHPFLKPPPWSSSSRAPLQHPQVAAIGNTKKKPPAHHYGAFFHHLWYWWVDMGGFPSKKNPLMTTGTAAKNWDAPTEEVAQLGPSAQTGRFPPTNRENPSKISGLSGILHWFVGFLWLQDDYRSSMVY